MTALDRKVIAPAFVLFAILVAHALLETARDALFLARLGPHLLAAAYIAMASAALLAIAAVRRWSRLRDPRRVLIAFLAVAVAGTTALDGARRDDRRGAFARVRPLRVDRVRRDAGRAQLLDGDRSQLGGR